MVACILNRYHATSFYNSNPISAGLPTGRDLLLKINGAIWLRSIATSPAFATCYNATEQPLSLKTNA